MNIKDIALYGLALFGGYAIYEKMKNKEKIYLKIIKIIQIQPLDFLR